MQQSLAPEELQQGAIYQEMVFSFSVPEPVGAWAEWNSGQVSMQSCPET